MTTGVAFIVGYVIAIISPLLLVVLLGLHSPNDASYEIARSFGLSAFVVLALQPFLAARIKWVEKPFGLDMVIRFHRAMGVFAAVLLLLHPLLLAVGGAGFDLITSLHQPWYIWLGKGGLALLLIYALSGLFWKRIGLTFETWRKGHYGAAPLIILLGFLHAVETGDDLKETSVRALFYFFLLIAFGSYFYHKVIKPILLARRPYRVTEVIQETHNVWTVKAVPPEGQPIPTYHPGQFHFITFQRLEPPVEEHHWTISSSPTEKGFLSSTIKESGDFTKTIGKTVPGDRAIIQGPFGRFSYTLYPQDKRIVFIAGGIGITPIRAMLRHMRDTEADIEVLLLYANRAEKDIVFHEELTKLEIGEKPSIKVVHVLSNPDTSWTGEKGHIDRELIERLAGTVTDKVFYVCGPPGMSSAVIDALREMGVAYENIRTEVFSL